MTTQKPLTEDQLDDIENRATAATPGPWTVSEDYSDVITPDGGQLASYWNPTSETRNGEFIAAARTDVPALLAEVRRLKAITLDLAARWEKEANATERAADTDSFGVEIQAEQQERVRIYREAARDLRTVLETGRIPDDLLTAADVAEGAQR